MKEGPTIDTTFVLLGALTLFWSAGTVLSMVTLVLVLFLHFA